jgi:hypothetical protein
LLSAIFTDSENLVLIKIVHDRDVLGPLAECGLINADTARPSLLHSREPSSSGPLVGGDCLRIR